jgi:hypothetical protein
VSNPRRDRLLTLLTQLDDLLALHHVRYDVLVHELRQRIGEEEGRSVSDDAKAAVLAMFGGMGSLTDIWICRDNGHRVDDEKEANSKLAALKSELYRELTGD